MCDRGRGSKLVQNSVTYFMDGPSAVSSVSSEGAGQIRQAFASSFFESTGNTGNDVSRKRSYM